MTSTMSFDQVMTADVEKLSGDELQASLDELNRTVDAMKARSRVITQEQNVRLAKSRIGAVLAAIPPGVRDQVLQGAAVESTKAVGTPRL